MSRVITIDPGKSKCGLVLAEISEKKVYKAIILKSELLGNYVRNLITAEQISQFVLVSESVFSFTHLSLLRLHFR